MSEGRDSDNDEKIRTEIGSTEKEKGVDHKHR